MKGNKIYFDFFRDCQARGETYMILQGSRRSGKSIAIEQDICKDLSTKRKQRAVIVTDTFSRLENSIKEDFKLIDPTQRYLKWSGVPRVDFHATGNTINFVYDGKNTLGTTSNLTHIFFNECINYEEKVVHDLLYAAGNNCKIYFDYNPYTRFYVNDKYENGTNKLITTWRDNNFIPEGAKRALLETERLGKDALPGTLERYLYEVECLGLNSDVSGSCFPNSEICDDIDYDNCDAPEILASDWGQILSNADPDVLFGFKFTEDKVFCREYYYRNDGTDKDIADVLASIPFKRQYYVFETATAGEVRIRNIYAHSGLKFQFVPATKGSGSVMIGIRNLQRYRLMITRSSINFINEQRNYKYVSNGSILQPIDKYNHGFDCLRYAYNFYSVNKSKIR